MAFASAISCSVRATSCSPWPGTPSACATAVICPGTPARVRVGSKKITGTPAARNWSWTDLGPMLVSVSTTVGARFRIASAFIAWPPGVTFGMSFAAGNADAVSRPTTLSPSPRANTVSVSVP